MLFTRFFFIPYIWCHISGRSSELEEVMKEAYSSPARLTQKEVMRETYSSPIHSRFNQKTALNLNSLSPTSLTNASLHRPAQPLVRSPNSPNLSSFQPSDQQLVRSPTSLAPFSLQAPFQPCLRSPSLCHFPLQTPGKSPLHSSSPFRPSNSTSHSSLSTRALPTSPSRNRVHFSPPPTPCTNLNR